VTPHLTLTPSSAISGTVVTATGAGFGAAETVTLSWGGLAHGPVLTTTPTNVHGRFGAITPVTFTVPSVAPGSYTVCGGALIGGQVGWSASRGSGWRALISAEGRHVPLASTT